MNARGNEAGGTVPFNAEAPDKEFTIEDCVNVGLGTWTASAEKALVFHTELEAEVFARNQDLQNFRVVRRP